MLTQEGTNYIGLKLHSALYQAVIRNDISSCRYLLKHGASPNYINQDEGHFTPLHWAVILSDNDVLCQLLLNNGADPNWINKEGRTPLHYAAILGKTKIAHALLTSRYKININALDSWNGTPLFYAARQGYLAIVKQLVQKGVNINSAYNTYSIRWFLQWRDAIEIIQNTALIEAVQNNHIDIVRCLIQAGADLNAKGVHNNTALHFAIFQENLSMVSLLIKNKADVLIENSDGNTPKGIAVLERKEKILSYLAGNLQRQLSYSTPGLCDAVHLFVLLTPKKQKDFIYFVSNEACL